MTEQWHLQCSRGFLDAIIDLSSDLQKSETLDLMAFDDDGSRNAIIESVEARIGKPSDIGDLDKEPPAFDKYFKTHKGENWSEGRFGGYACTLQMLCYLDCGSGSGKALINIGRWFQGYYGVENTMDDGGMESLIDLIDDDIGSPPDADEGYSNGYKNMMRLIRNMAYMNGI